MEVCRSNDACANTSIKEACVKGHLAAAQWLWSLNPQLERPINVHACNEAAFRWACRNGHVAVTQWLLGLAKGEVARSNTLVVGAQ